MDVTPHPKSGGRTATFAMEDVVAAGVRIGLANLTVQGVARALGVSSAAIYRHVPGRLALERLVGETILADLDLPDDPALPARAHLLAFAVDLRRFALAHPGTAGYLQRLFPRGPSGGRLLEAQIAALGPRGFDPAAATVLCSSTAMIALGLTANDEARAAQTADDPAGTEAEIQEALALLAASPVLREAHLALPRLTPDEYFAVLMGAVVDGLLLNLPPGRPVAALTGTPHREDT
ncbi:TetR/AcrR family transcriptional regulator [Longispora sp. NPDC051575]|uniref:TetR/AcrR family transcriptional regulator n=1 Tax=Longispora sp. NPDC051575 TaxID=3154943 RepID=UPI003413F339